MSIVLQFVAADDLSSAAIETFERGWCSHVDAVMDSGELLGARLDGVKVRPEGYEQWTRARRVALPASTMVTLKFYEFLGLQLGKPYDTTAIAAFPLGRDWRKPDAWFCSELIAAGLEAALWFPAPLSEGVNKITPRDLELLLSPWWSLVSDSRAAAA